MKTRLMVLFLLLAPMSILKASPQSPDYIIIGNDTLTIYQFNFGGSFAVN